MESVGSVKDDNHVIVDLDGDKCGGDYQNLVSPGVRGQVINWDGRFMQQKQKVVVETRVNNVLSDIDLEGFIAVREWKECDGVRVSGDNELVVCWEISPQQILHVTQSFVLYTAVFYDCYFAEIPAFSAKRTDYCYLLYRKLSSPHDQGIVNHSKKEAHLSVSMNSPK